MYKIIFNKIQKILNEGNIKFKLNDELNITLENILTKINSYIKPNPQIIDKKYLIDISYLKRNDNINEKTSNIIIEKEEINNFYNKYHITDDKFIAERKITSNEILTKEKKEENEKIKFLNEENEYIDEKLNDFLKEENSLNEEIINDTLNNENKIENITMLKVIPNKISFSKIYVNYNDEIKKVNKNEEEKEKDYINHLLETKKKPLDFFNLYETKFKDNLQNKIIKKKDFFPLTTYFSNNTTKLEIFKKEENEILSNLILKSKINEKLNSFCLQNISNQTFLYCGSNKGFIYKYDINNNTEVGKYNTKEGDILCIEVYENYIVTGHQNGAIHILNNGNVIETIKDENLSPIICLKIVKINNQKNKFEIIYSNRDRQIKLIFKKKSLLVYKMKFETILLTPSPVYNIINYNPIPNLSISKKKKMIFCFVSIKNITIMPISPIFTKQEDLEKHILAISRPDNVCDNDIPHCCFGYGYLPENLDDNINIGFNKLVYKDNGLLLFVAWGKNVRIYKEIIDKGIKKFKLNCIYIFALPIIKISYFAYSSIVIVDQLFNINVLFTFNFEKNIYAMKDTKIKRDKFQIIPLKLENISYKIFSYDNPDYNPGINSEPKKIQNTIYSNFIIENLSHNNLIIIGEKEIFFIGFNSWKNLINKFLEKGHLKNMFYCVLICVNSFILQNNKEIEQGLFTEYKEQFCYEILFKTLNIIKDKKDELYLDIFIREIFEFSIKADSYQTLYKFLESSLKVLQNKNIVYKIFTDYLSEANNILPNSFFEEFNENFIINYINFYSEQKSLIELSNNLLNFSPRILKYSKVKKLIKEKELVEPYIYLCMNLTEEEIEKIKTCDKEYYKPIEFLYNLFVTKNESEEYNNFIINHNYKIKINEIHNYKGYFGHKLFWFIDSILNQKIYLKKEQPDLFSYHSLIKRIILLLTGKDSLKNFIRFDSISFFQIFRKFFLDNKIYAIINDYFDDEEFESFANTINSPDIYISELTPKMFLDFVIESIYEEENNFFMKKDLFDFICDFSPFMNKTFWVTKNTLLEAVKFLIDYPREYQKYKKYDTFQYHINQSKKEVLTNENKILKLISIANSKSLLNEDDCETLINILNESDYSNIAIFVYDISNNYKKTLELKLQNNDLDPDELFKWIEETINKINNNEFDNFKNIIMDKLKELLNISVTHFSKLVDKYFDKQQNIIVQQLDDNPSLQLNYIDKYLESSENDDFKTLEFFIEKKIYLLVNLRQNNKIIDVLKENIFVCNNDFLNKMKKNNIIEAVIYINKTLGNYNEAMNLTIESIKNIKNDILKELLLSKFNNEILLELNDKNNILIKLGLSICESSSNIRSKHIQQCWVNLLNELYEFKYKLNEFSYKSEINNEKKKIIEDLKKNTGNHIEKILISMTDYNELLPMIDLISNKFNKFGTSEFAHLIMQIINSFEKSDAIYKIVEIIFKITNYNELMNFSNENRKGISFIIDKCDLCKKEINENNIVIFKCGHKYHKYCCYLLKISDELNPNINDTQEICYICKKDDIDTPLYLKEVIISNSPQENNNKIEIDLHTENEEIKKEKNQKMMKQKAKLNYLRKMKKRNISLMNFLYQTESYILVENNK